MKILFCDDQIQVLHQFEYMSHLYEKENNEELEILAVDNFEDGKNFNPDLIFLDIEMPEKNGITIKNELEQSQSKSLIVFVTNYTENVFDAFGLNVIGFFQKPIDYEKFKTLIEKVKKMLIGQIIVEIDSTLCVKVNDIRYIDMERVYSNIHFSSKISNSPLSVRKSLNQWKQLLPDTLFIEINKSCIVNCCHISKYSTDFVIMNQTGEKLKISRRKKLECAKKYKEFSAIMARY